MAHRQENHDRAPRIKSVESAQLTGPIPIGPNPYGATAYFTFSGIVVCDWLSAAGYWLRDDLKIPKSGGRGFPFQSVKHVHVLAWPCAMTDYSTEDGGWAVDGWRAECDSSDGHADYIDIILHVAVRGEGARLNRIGYTWTAYVADPGEVGPHPASG